MNFLLHKIRPLGLVAAFVAALAVLGVKTAGAYSASGGNSTYTSGGYVYHVFTSGGTLYVSGTIPSADILVVGGGGGGGLDTGGGGGGGGVVATSSSLSGNIGVSIGGGGGSGSNGGNSSFGGWTAYGGGYGGGYDQSGNSGGSGGGGGSGEYYNYYWAPGGNGGSGSQGGSGAHGYTSGGAYVYYPEVGWTYIQNPGGGGGGAGGNASGYNGGSGYTWLGTTYAGGGGGYLGSGGSGGGGTGGSGAGTYYGAGGGGGGVGGSGGSGYSGIVIVRYPVPPNPPVASWGSPGSGSFYYINSTVGLSASATDSSGTMTEHNIDLQWPDGFWNFMGRGIPGASGTWSGAPSGGGSSSSRSVSFTPDVRGTWRARTYAAGGGGSTHAPDTTGIALYIANRPTTGISVNTSSIYFGQTVNVSGSYSADTGMGDSVMYTILASNGPVQVTDGSQGGPGWGGAGYSYYFSWYGDARNPNNHTVRPTTVGTYYFYPAMYAGQYQVWTNWSNASATVTVNKATPSIGGWSNQSRSGTGTFPGAFTASASNPYSGSVAAPTGSISYSVVGASGAGASPTSGAVGSGTTFMPGTYTVRASYPGDGNYNATSADVTFTVGNTLAQMASFGSSPSTITFGETSRITSTATDADGNLTFHGLLHLKQDSSNWMRGSMTDHSTGWGNHEVDPSIYGASYSSGVTSGGSSTRWIDIRPTWAGTHTFHSNANDSLNWASDAGNWGSQAGYVSLVVNKATPSISGWSNQSRTGKGAFTWAPTLSNPYSGAVAAPSGGLSYTVVSAAGALASPTSGAVASGQVFSPGTYTVRASYGGDGNYNAATWDVTFTVSNAAPVNVSMSTNKATYTYGETVTVTARSTDVDGDLNNHHIVVAHVSHASNSWEGNSPDGWKWQHYMTLGFAASSDKTSTDTLRDNNYGKGTNLPPGTYRLTLNSQDSVPNYTYSAGNVMASFTINKANQTISFGALAGKTYGDAPFSVSATASSGLAVTYSIVSGPATIAGNTVTITGAGTVVVRASQGGDTNYNAAPNVDQSFVVAKANQSAVSISPTSQTILTSQAINFTASGGTTGYSWGGTAGATGSGSTNNFTFNTAGTFTVTVQAPATANYNASNTATATITVNQGYTLTVNAATGGSATGGGFYQSGTNQTITATANAGYVFAGWTGPDVGSVANPYAATTTISMGGNRSVTPSFVAISSAVDRGSVDLGTAVLASVGSGNRQSIRDLLLTNAGGAGVAVKALYVLTGTADFSVVPSLGNVAPGGTSTNTVTFSPAGVTNDDRSGSLLVVTADPSEPVTSYTLVGHARAGQTITFGALADKTYGDAAFTVSATASSGLPPSFSIVSGPATIAGNTVTITGAGVVTVRAGQAGNNNWVAAANVDRSFTVNKANQTAPSSITPTTLTYGGTFNNTTFTAGAGSRLGTATWEYRTSSSGAWSPLTATNVTTPGAGTYLGVRVNYAGNSNYNSATSAEQVITIIKTDQAALTVNASTPQTYAASQTLTTTGGSGGGAVSYAVVAESSVGVSTLVGSTLTANAGAGWVDVQATKAADSNYNAVTSGVVRINFQKANQTAPSSITPTALTYGGNFSSASFTAGAGTRLGATSWEYRTSSSGSWSPLTATNIAIPGAGTYLGVRVTYAGDANYNSSTSAEQVITINKASQAALTLVAATPQTYVSNQTLSVTGGSGTGSVTYSIVGQSAAGVATLVGSTLTANTGTGWVDVQATKATDSNYNAATSATVRVTFQKADQSIPSSITPVALTYGGTFSNATFTAGAGTRVGTATWEYRTSSSGAWSPLTATNVTTPGAGTYLGVRVGYAGNNDYNAATAAEQIVTINKANQTITFGALAGKTYGDAPFTVSATATSGLAVTYSIVSGPATIAGNTVTITGAGTVIVRASQAGDGNYNAAANVDQSFAVAKANQTITFGALANKTYGDADFTVSATASSGLSPTFSIVSGPATIAGNTVTITGAGTVVVRAGQAGNTNYNAAANVDQSFTVAKANQAAVTVSSSATTTYGAAYTATATGGNGTGGIVWALGTGSTAANAAINATTGAVTADSTGTVVIKAYRALDANYNQSATTADFTVTFAARPITISLSGSKTYDGTATATGATFTPTSGSLAGSDTRSSTLTLASANAGTYTATITHTISNAVAPNTRTASYAITNTGAYTINKANQTITFGALAGKTYGDAPFTVSATASSGLSPTFSIVSGPATIAGNTVTITGAGTVVVRASQAGNGNYNAAPNVDQSFVVAKANQPAVTINSAATATYGTTYTATATGGAGTGALTWALGTGSTASGAAINASTGVITANSTGTVVVNVYRAADGNYSQSATTADFTVTVGQRPITVTLTGSKVYDGTTASTGASASITSGSLAGTDTIGYAFAALSSANVGSYSGLTTATISNAAAPLTRTSNYAITYTGAVSVTAKPITVTAASPSKTYDGATLAVGNPTVATLVAGDALTGFTGTTSVGPGAGTYATTVTAITTTNGASNYSPTFVAGSATINKANQAAVTVTSAATATYGTTYTATATGGTGTGSIVWALGTGSTAANAAINSSTGVITAGSTGTVVIKAYRAGDGNYNQSATTADFTVTVGQRPITVTLTGSKVYDGTTASTGASASITSGSLAGTDTIGYAFAALSSANVGSYSGLTTATISNASAPLNRTSNYAITYTGAVSVTAKAITVTAVSPSKTYDGATLAVGNPTVATLVAGDALTGFTGTTSVGPGAGTYATTVTAITTTNGASNYSPTFVAGSATINKANQTITFGALAGKTYGDAPFTVSATASSGLAPTYSIVSGPATIAGSTVTITGAGTVVVRASQAGNGNYNAAPNVDQSFVVAKATQAAVTISSAATATYGTTYTATATGGSGTGTIVWALGTGSTAANAAINASTGVITADSTGTVVIKAYRALDGNYNQSATTADFTVTVGPRPITVTLAGSKTYDGSTTSTGATFTVTSGSLAGTDSIASTLTLASANAGTYTATVAHTISNAAAPTTRTASYTITNAGSYTINKANQTITFGALAGKTYGDAPFTVSATASSGLTPTYSIVSGPATIAGNTVTITGAGTVVVRASQAGNGNYNAAPNVDQSFVVAKANQASVTVNSVATATYGTTYTATATGGSGTGAIVWALGTGSTAANAAINASTGVITADSTGTVVIKAYRATDSNYNQSATTADFTVTVGPRPITVTLTGTKVYNGNTTSTGASASITAGNLAAGDSIAYAFANTASANVGTYTGLTTATISNAAAPTTRTASYTVTYTGSYAISKATPTIYWPTPAAITYGTALSGTQLNARAVASTLALNSNGSTNLNAASAASDGTGMVITTGASGGSYRYYFDQAALVPNQNYTIVVVVDNITGSGASTSLDWCDLGAATQSSTSGGFTTFTGVSSRSSYDATYRFVDLNLPANSSLRVRQVYALNQAAFPGTFTYNPASGAVLGAGTQTLNVTFTPTDTTNINTASGSVSLVVNKANQAAVSINSAATATYGTTYTATATGGNGTGSFVWALGTGSTAANAAINASTGVITADSTGTVVVKAYRALDANYNQSATTADFTITVNARPITVKLAGSKIYNGNTTPTGASASITAGSLAGTDTIAYAFANVSSANAGTYTGLTSATVSNAAAPTARTASYAITYDPTGIYTINKANQTITFGALAGKTYGDAPFTVSATASSGLSPTYSIVSGPATIAGNTVTITGAGTVVVRASQAGDGNYNAAPNVDQSFIVAKAAQAAVSISSAASATYGTTYTATATGGNGTGGIVWALGTGSTAANAAINASTGVITADSTGTVVVKAYRATDSNYLQSATTADFTITVGPRPITVTLAGSKTYDGNTTSTGASASITSGSLAGTDTIAYAFAATSSANAGTYSGLTTATISNAAAPTTRTANYTITYAGSYTINKANQAAVSVSSAATATYGTAYSATASGGSGTGAFVWALGTGSTAANAAINASTGVITADSSGTVVVKVYRALDGNYNQSATTADFTITVNPRPITVTLAGSKTYDASVAPTGASASITSGSLAGTDTIAYAFANTSSANAGTYSGLTTATVSNAASPTTRTGSYAITYAGSYTINKANQGAVTINSAATATYGTTYTATATGGNGTGALVWALGTGSTAANAAINASTGVITADSTGTVVVKAYRALDGNYNQSATTADFTITVNARPITVTLAGSKIYNGNTTPTGASASITSGSLAGADTIAYAFANTSSANAGTYTGLTTATISNAAAPTTRTASYAVTYAGSYAVNKANQTITFGALAGKTYGDAPFTVSATASSGLTPTYSIVSGPATIAGNTVTITGAGTVVVRASQGGDVNYNAAPNVDQSFVVAKAAQAAVSVNSAVTATYGTAYTATATGGNGTGSFVWALGTGSTAANAAINASTGVITADSTGTVVVKVYRATDSNYLQSATTADFTITVNPRPITVTLAGSKTYDGNVTPAGASASITTGTLAAGDTIAYAFANVSSANAGTYTGLTTATVSNVAAPTTRSASYTISYAGSYTINKANQTITFGALAGKTYGDAPFTVSATASSGLSPTFSIVSGPATVAGNTVTITGAGTVVVRASQAGNGNYNAAPNVDQSFVVAKATQAAVTINSAATATYGTTYTATATGGNGTGAITWALGTGSTAANAAINASTGVITADSTGTVVVKSYRATDSNYLQSATTADFTITVGARPITVTLAGSKTYDGSTTSTGASASITAGSLAGTDTIAYAFANTSSANAGTYTGLTTATISNAINPTARTGNYAITYAGTYTINKANQAAVTINSAATATYGTAYTATATGGNGTGAIVWALGTGSTAANAAINASTGVITADSTGTVVVKAYRALDGNYNQSATTADFTITVGARPITVTLAGSKTYDGSVSPTGASATITSGTLAGTDTIAYAFANTSSANAGTYTGLTTATVSNATAPTARTSSYAITYVGSYVINKANQAAVTINSPASATYGTTYTATATGGNGTGSLVWALGTGSTAANAAINASTGVITADSTGTIVVKAYRALDGNYNQSATTADFTITVGPRPITVTLAGSKVYNGNTTPVGASATITSGNLAGSDTIAYAFANTSSANAGTYTGLTTATVSNAAAPTARSASYTISYAGSYTINKANQTITFGSLAGKTYGDAPFTVSATASSGLAPTYSIVSGPATIAGNTVTITGAGTVTVRASQAGDINYNAAVAVDQSFVVAKAAQGAITVSSAATATYGTTYTATATGGNGTGGLVWALGTGSTAANAAINASTGVITADSTGTVVVKVYRATDSNYLQSATTADFTITVNARPITVTLAGSKTYDGSATPTGASASITSGSLASGDTIAYGFSAPASANAGSYTGLTTATISNAAAPTARSASYAITYAGSYTINKANQTITFGALAGKTYGDAPFTVSATASSGLTPTFSIVSGPATIAGNTVTITGAGTVVVRASQTGNGNYNAATNVDQSFVVAKAAQAALSISSAATVTYGTTYTAAVSGGSGTGAIVWALGTGSTAANAAINASTGVITADSTGTVVVKAYKSTDSNYLQSATTADFTITVNPRPITVTLAGSKTYDGNATPTGANATITAGTLAGSDTIAYAFANTGSANAGTYTGLTTATISNVANPTARSGNYTISYAGSYTINKANQTITFGALAGKTYGDAPFTVSATASSGLAPAFSVVSGPATIAGNTVTITGAGTVVVRASQGGDINYNAATAVDQSFVVAKAAQPTVSINSASTATYGTTYTATVTGGAGTGAFVWALGTGSTAANAAVNASTGVITADSTGTVVVKVYRATDSNYLQSATTADFTITVGARPITVTLAGSKTYNGDAVPTGASATITAGNLAGSDTIAYAFANTSSANAGSYTGLTTATISNAANPTARTANYAITYAGSYTINKAPQATVVINSPTSATYGTTYTATATGGNGAGAIIWALGTGSTAANAAINASTGVITADSTGTVVIKAYRATETNYLQSATTADFTVNVGPRPITVTLTGSKTYDGGATPTGASASITSGSLAGSDTIAYAFANTASANAGTYTGLTTATVSNAAAPTARTANYTITYAGSYIINKANQAAVTITSPATATYGTAYTAAVAGGNGTGAFVWALGTGSTAANAAIGASTGAITADSSGTVVVKAYRAGDINYNQSTTTADFTITVNPRPITVTLSGSKTYNGNATPTGASATITAGSLAGTDTIAYVFANTSSANAGTYTGLTTATVSNAAAPTTRTSSYAITYAGSYTVNKAPQATVVISSPASATYGTTYTAAATGGDGTGAIVWALGTGSTAANAAINASTGVITANSTGTVVIKAYRATETNYLQSATTADFTVTVGPRPITVTLAGSKTYTGNAAPTGATASITAGTLASGDTIAYAFANTASANAGTYTGLTTATVSNAAAPTARTSSYAITYAGSFAVTKAPLTVSAENAFRPYGDPNPTFVPAYSGFVNGETQAALTGAPSFGTAALVTSPIGTYPITVTQGTLAATNYSFTFNPGVLSVGKALLTVSTEPATKVVGTANPVFVASYTGFRNGDTPATALTGLPGFSTSAGLSTPVGSYQVTVGQGTLAAANYNFTFTPGTLNITKATPSMAVPPPADPVYTGLSYTMAPVLTGAFNPTGTKTYNVQASTGGAAASFAGDTMTVNAVGLGGGTLTVQVNYSGDENNYPAYASVTLNVQRQPTVVTASYNIPPAIQNNFVTDQIYLVGSVTSTITAAQVGTPTYTIVSYTNVVSPNYAVGATVSSGFVVGGTVTNADGSADVGFAAGQVVLKASYPGGTFHQPSETLITIPIKNPGHQFNVRVQAIPAPGMEPWLSPSEIVQDTFQLIRAR